MMHNFIRVTKDNKKRDRGFIAVDAICSVFENQEMQNTQIMTMDGMWYDVTDGVEKLYEACESANVELVSTGIDRKSEFIKKRRMQSSALSEKVAPVQKCDIQTDVEKSGNVAVEGKSVSVTDGDKRRYRFSRGFSPGGEGGRYSRVQREQKFLEGGYE